MGATASKTYEVFVEDAKNMPDVSPCDLVVLGSPIYYEKALPSVRKFVEKNDLSGKKVALFIMCLADKFGKIGVKYTENRYVKLASEGIKGDIIAIRVFRGWILKEDKKTIEEGKEWIKRVSTAMEKGEKIPVIEHSDRKK